MPLPRCRVIALAALSLAACLGALPNPAAAQPAWPSKPIRFVVPYPPGGPLDQVARALSEQLREPLGQPVVIENRPGAGGNIGADLVAKSAPDGYSIVMGAVATHAINPYLYAESRDRGKLGVNNVGDLVDYAQRNPGKLNYVSGSNDSAGHLAGELLESLVGIAMVHIPYGGAAPAQFGLLAGQTDLMFDNLASVGPQIRAGKLKALAVTTSQRLSFFPELPTMAESLGKPFD